MKRITKPAAYGFISKGYIIILYSSDEAYFNWLSKAIDDNPDYAKTT